MEDKQKNMNTESLLKLRNNEDPKEEEIQNNSIQETSSTQHHNTTEKSDTQIILAVPETDKELDTINEIEIKDKKKIIEDTQIPKKDTIDESVLKNQLKIEKDIIGNNNKKQSTINNKPSSINHAQPNIDIKSSSAKNKENQTNDSERICRICYDDQSQEKLISPCKCSGSVKWVHNSCLQKWIDISKKNECSTCKYTYKYQKEYTKKFYKYLDHSYVPKLLTIIFILITTIISGLISKLCMKILKFKNNIDIGFNIKYFFFSLKYFSLLFFLSLPILHYLKVINVQEVYNNYISLYERNNTLYGQGISDISIFIYLTIFKFFEDNLSKLTKCKKIIIDYHPESSIK